MSDDLEAGTQYEWLKELIITQRKTIQQQLDMIYSKDVLIQYLQQELEKVTKHEPTKPSSTVSRPKAVTKRKKAKH